MWHFHVSIHQKIKWYLFAFLLVFMGRLEWNISWPRRTIWPLSVALSHNINFYDPTVLLPDYLTIFIVLGMSSLSCFYGNRRKWPLGTLYTFPSFTFAKKRKKKERKQKEVKEGGNTIEVLNSWKYKEQNFLQMFMASISYLIYLYDSTKSLNHTKILNIWNGKMTALILL